MLYSILEMSLDWCKVLRSESGWVSDNYLGYAKIIKWYYHLFQYCKTKTIYKELTSPTQTWKGQECKDWLSACDILFVGEVNILRLEITRLMNQDEGSPPILRQQGCGVKEFYFMVGSLFSCVAKVMERELNLKDVDELDREIQLFLNNIHIVESSLREGKSDVLPLWLTKYNFQSLLNLPGSMRTYGLLINLWEGWENTRNIRTGIKLDSNIPVTLITVKSLTVILTRVD